jgi:hypothetical protein
MIYRLVGHFGASDKVMITELNLKNIRSGRNSHVQLTLILKIIGQCGVKHTDKNSNTSIEDLDIHYH